MHGVRLVLLRPDASSRDCGECVRWMHRDSPEHMGPRLERPAGVPVPRGHRPGSGPPCRYCPKQPHGVPPAARCRATAEELSDKNWAAYAHYLECRATGQFPADAIVSRNAALIRGAEDAAARMERVDLAQLSRVPIAGGN